MEPINIKNLLRKAKMAKRDGISTDDLRMHVLGLWETESTEYRIMRLVRAFGMGEWSSYHAFSSADAALGGRIAMQHMSRADKRKGGRIQGRKNIESGLLARICKDGGRVQGKKNAESGHFASITTQESLVKGSKAGNHTRWHINRGIINPDCPLCAEKQDG